jgi:hypothetical protein
MLAENMPKSSQMRLKIGTETQDKYFCWMMPFTKVLSRYHYIHTVVSEAGEIGGSNDRAIHDEDVGLLLGNFLLVCKYL